MDSNRFKKSGYEVVEWAVQYMQSMCERKVLPAVVPGYMRSLVPTEAPEKPETFDRVMRDLEPIILTGVSSSCLLIRTLNSWHPHCHYSDLYFRWFTGNTPNFSHILHQEMLGLLLWVTFSVMPLASMECLG